MLGLGSGVVRHGCTEPLLKGGYPRRCEGGRWAEPSLSNRCALHNDGEMCVFWHRADVFDSNRLFVVVQKLLLADKGGAVCAYMW